MNPLSPHIFSAWENDDVEPFSPNGFTGKPWEDGEKFALPFFHTAKCGKIYVEKSGYKYSFELLYATTGRTGP